jgi:hypothetical protein
MNQSIFRCKLFLAILISSCLLSSSQSLRFLNQIIRKPAAIFTAAILSTFIFEEGRAIAETPEPIIISGSIRFSKDIFKDAAPTFSPKGAIYATVRQDLGTWTSAVRNIKAPPVLSKRIALTEFDSEKQLKDIFPMKIVVESPADSTPEGLALIKDWSSGKNFFTN